MSTFQIMLLINYILSALAVLGMVFFSNKKPQRIAAWLITLIFLPFLGLFIFVLIGYGLNYSAKNMIKKRRVFNENYDAHLKQQVKDVKNAENSSTFPVDKRDLILLNLNNSNSIYTKNNGINFFVDGKKMIEQLKKDIISATSTINILYYIFSLDKTGKEITNLLVKKAKQGVEVKLLYDAVGSISTFKRNFKNLREAGGKIEEFFPPLLGIKLLNLKANYRNHRKIVVIDGKIGWTGGMNIRDDHMGFKKKLSPWRDTQIRIVGDAVYTMQNLFLSDWRYATKDASNPTNETEMQKYFPKQETQGEIAMQVISSGPDNNLESIKECFIKMVMSAKRKVKLQTPYFIPDEAFMSAIKLALLSGVEIEIMVPKLADRWFVHYATMSYLREIKKMGAKVFVYSGFLHSKTISVDEEILSVGTCNIDIRSFALNFEDSVIIYDSTKTKEYDKIFENDKIRCQEIDNDYFKDINILKKFLTSVCRLFSSVL